MRVYSLVFCNQGNYSVMHVLKLKVLCGRIRVFVDCVFPVETFMQRPVCPGRRKILSFCFM